MAISTALMQKPDVAVVVKLKGRVTAAGVSEAVGFDASKMLDELTADGHVEPVKAGFKITPTGLDVVNEALGAVRRDVGDRQLNEWYEVFCTINADFKATVTDWQLRQTGDTAVLNDHTDANYDGAVIARLQVVHASIVALLDQFPPSIPRYRRYRNRLDEALRKLVAGQLQFMASPAVESYHSVWFELHEELIMLCGLTRAGEAEAGRGC